MSKITEVSCAEGVKIIFAENNVTADGCYDPHMDAVAVVTQGDQVRVGEEALAFLKANGLTLGAGMRFAPAAQYLTSMDQANRGAFGDLLSPVAFEGYLLRAGEAAKELGIDFEVHARDLVERYLENALTAMEGLTKEFGRPKFFMGIPIDSTYSSERTRRCGSSGVLKMLGIFSEDLRRYVLRHGVLKVADELRLYAARYELLTNDLEARIEKVRVEAPAGLAHPLPKENGIITGGGISLSLTSGCTGFFSFF